MKNKVPDTRVMIFKFSKVLKVKNLERMQNDINNQIKNGNSIVAFNGTVEFV